ncbi:hypothetical protein HZC27_04220 [Candidatus Roizmanbacteria bacterium]|nr:hypothetical protein [Candidatus Roizmanbacteria bacterium]
MRKYVILFIISCSIFLIHFLKVKHGIYGDGNGYYSIAHTLFFQRGLNFAPIYYSLSHFQGASYEFSRVFWNTSKTVTGGLNNPWLIGTSLFWLPSFFFISILNFVFNLKLSMFSSFYEIGCGVTGILLVLTGLFFLESYLRHHFDKKISSYTVLSIFFSSQLFYYASFEPALSHQVSFFLVCLLLFLTAKKITDPLSAVVIGLTVGLLSITRMGDTLLVLPWLLLKFREWVHAKKYTNFILIVFAFCISLVPQLLLQWGMYGSAFQNPYLQGEKGTPHLFTLSSIIAHLFSPKGGFLLWSPLFAAGIFGLMKMRKSQFFLIILILFTLLISSWESQVPAGFGNRFFISAIPLMAPGVAYLFKNYEKRLLIFSTLCFLWNIFLLTRFYF